MEANRGIRSGGHTTSGDQKTPHQGRRVGDESPAKGHTPAASAEGAVRAGETFRPPAVLAELKGHVALLNASVFADWSQGETLAGLDALETVKRMAEARQALLTAHLVQVRCQEHEAADRSVRNVPAEVGKDLGLVRKLNGSKARALVDLAIECPAQAPQAFRLWVDGKVSEEQALILFKQTTLLTPAGRTEADEQVAEDLPVLGLRELRKRLDNVVAELEPELVAERRRKAASQRRAGFTYRPDGMMNLNALLPGVAGQVMDAILSAYARSKRHGNPVGTSGKAGADGNADAGWDERTQDQLKADLLTALVIGWARATKSVPEDFLKTHHVGCGGEPGNPCTQTHADDPDHEQTHDHASTEPDAEGEPNTAGELCAPTVGFADVETVGDLFEHLLPGQEGSIGEQASTGETGRAGGVWVPDGMEYDPTLGLLLPAGVGVHVNLVMTDLAAFGITDQPAQLFGLGPIPADMARELVQTAHTRHAATLRRLYTEPGSGALMKMESAARAFPDGLGQMISIRDGHCRYPFCDAPIRHLDHIQPHADGGATSYGNGQGLCARHNLLKEANHTTTYPEPVEGSPGGGAVITILGGGMKFTSPARAFPTESPTSVAEDHYWRGYREGRADQRQQQHEREQELQNQENAIYTAEDRLRQLAAQLLDNGAA